ncbi:MAG: hypothetical protein LBC20_00920 [Planctomycetaceae bacterium]|nr:hypothetical protein [Planctomycetaceae bacterium]
MEELGHDSRKRIKIIGNTLYHPHSSSNTEKHPIIINRVPELREDLQQLFQLASPEILPVGKPTTPRTEPEKN